MRAEEPRATSLSITASDGLSRRSSVRALKVSPQTVTLHPCNDPPTMASTLSATRSNWALLTSITPRSSPKSYPASSAMCTRARESFGKQLPPQPGPGLRNSKPMRLS